MIIYKATNKINGKCYIGQTIHTLKSRRKNHLWLSTKNNNIYFQNALKKYNNNFEWEIIEKCDSKEELDEMEFHYIKQYDSYWQNGKGYNCTYGGEGQSGAISEETKNKMSISTIGFKHTKNTKKKMSESRKGKNNPMHGKITIGFSNHSHSKKSRKKISETMKKRWKNMSEEQRKKQICGLKENK